MISPSRQGAEAEVALNALGHWESGGLFNFILADEGIAEGFGAPWV
jgi:hypothetical protein